MKDRDGNTLTLFYIFTSGFTKGAWRALPSSFPLEKLFNTPPPPPPDREQSHGWSQDYARLETDFSYWKDTNTPEDQYFILLFI